MGGRRLTPFDMRRMRELRYKDGLTAGQTAEIIGCHANTVWQHTPGRPGKVPNDKLRAVFLSSRLTASEVARRMGWRERDNADSSRVKRVLGLHPDVNGRGHSSVRTFIDAEIAAQMADALGVMPWEIMPDEGEEAAA